MNRNVYLALFLLLASLSFAAEPMGIIFYYGDGCPHCARMEDMMAESLPETFGNYSINVAEKEVYGNAENRQELVNLFVRFGTDPSVRIPITLVDNRSLIEGEVSRQRFEEIVSLHLQNKTVGGVFNETSFAPVTGPGHMFNLTLPMLIGYAIADAVNPCTIAVMVMLLSTILAAEGRKKMFLAAVVFISVIFVCYLVMGLGLREGIILLKGTVERSLGFSITTAAYIAMAGLALVLSILELNAWFNYHPGFLAIEMPMFLRPHAKKIISGAASLPGVAMAALFCSIFLLPCSAGPYLVVLNMLSEAITVTALLYLIFYNIIFVLPMVIIATAIFLGRTTVERVGALKEKYIRHMHLFAGLVLLILFLVMLTQIPGVRLF